MLNNMQTNTHIYLDGTPITLSLNYNNSKKLTSISDNKNTTTTFAQTANNQIAHLNKNARKSWSSIAYNNRELLDSGNTSGIGNRSSRYEQQIAAKVSTAATAGTKTTATTNYENSRFNKGFSKFERSGQDVMARASQIVQ